MPGMESYLRGFWLPSLADCHQRPLAVAFSPLHHRPAPREPLRPSATDAPVLFVCLVQIPYSSIPLTCVPIQQPMPQSEASLLQGKTCMSTLQKRRYEPGNNPMPFVMLPFTPISVDWRTRVRGIEKFPNHAHPQASSAFTKPNVSNLV